MDFLKEAKEIKTELIKIRRHLHMYPELSGKEYRTAQFIAMHLKKWGLQVKTGVAGTGVIGLLFPSTDNYQPSTKSIALRADMDALPIQEETGKNYASKTPGIMHACGHDGNMTCVLGAVRLLSQHKKNLSWPVKFIFQPAEETSHGARAMIQSGCLQNPEVTAIIGIHMYTVLPTGTMGIKYGQMMAAVDEFTLTIIGEGGHGAAPHKGIDAVAISAEVITALQQIVSRKVDPIDSVVVTIGTIQGGHQYNIIADKVTMTGTVRTLNEKTHRQIPRLMERIVKGVTHGFGARYEFVYKRIGEPLVNDDRVLSKIEHTAKSVLGTRKVTSLTRTSMGGEDFALYLQRVEGAFIYLGVGNKQKGIQFPWHHTKFDIDEEALPIGAAVLAQTVWTW